MKRWVLGVGIVVAGVLGACSDRQPDQSTGWRAFWSADGTPPSTSVLSANESVSAALTNAVVLGERNGFTIVTGVDPNMPGPDGGRIALLVEGDSELLLRVNLDADQAGGGMSQPGRAIGMSGIDPGVASVRVYDSAGSHTEEPFVDEATGTHFVFVVSTGPVKLHGIQLLAADGKVLGTHSAVG